ncbi:T9SS type A sorting domain-containing protein [bacterium]|nr:T9SS type A sorting domain-containing protein [bacterium]
MRNRLGGILIGLFCLLALFARAEVSGPARGPVRSALDDPQFDSYVIDNGTFRMHIDNRGTIVGSTDPCPPNLFAPAVEFPAESGQRYLGMGGLWIGAFIEDSGFVTPRVSVASDFLSNPSVNELLPGGTEDQLIQIRSGIEGAEDCYGNGIYDPETPSDYEYVMQYSDTLTDPFWVMNDPVDGFHRPLGLEITQTVNVWEDASRRDFAIITFRVESISSNFLKQIYLGLLVENNAASAAHSEGDDDLVGFKWRDDWTFDTVNVAYFVDNDGWPPDIMEGDYDVPNVVGVMALGGYMFNPDYPFDRYETCFNWWRKVYDEEGDYGPAWESHADDGNSPLHWTQEAGIPLGDQHKFQLMSSGELDYDQVRADDQAYVEGHPQVYRGEEQPWSITAFTEGLPVANGGNTQSLISWGPLGIFDHVDGAGNYIYRLNPGEHFTFSIAILFGQRFHNIDNPQTDPDNINPNRFNYRSFLDIALRAKATYENPQSSDPGNSAPALPHSIALHQNYPNPFNSATTISFSIPESEHVALKIYDITGCEVVALLNHRMDRGVHTVEFNVDNLASGIYFYRLQAGSEFVARKMVLLR